MKIALAVISEMGMHLARKRVERINKDASVSLKADVLNLGQNSQWGWFVVLKQEVKSLEEVDRWQWDFKSWFRDIDDVADEISVWEDGEPAPVSLFNYAKKVETQLQAMRARGQYQTSNQT